MATKTFAQYEKEGWQENAQYYDDIDTPTTRQAIDPILAATGGVKGKRILELACGTGELARAVVTRGGVLTGLDVAPEMLAIARQKVGTDGEFVEGDAEDLKFADAVFDSVVCSFGLLHLTHPQRAMNEVARVLVPGGTFVFTVWCSPDDGNEFMHMILKSFEAHADMSIDLPAAPPMFELADPSACDPMLRTAGFDDITRSRLQIGWPISGAHGAYEFVLKGAVRTRMIYERQSEKVKNIIREDLAQRTSDYLEQGKRVIPIPAVLVCAKIGGQ